MKKIEIAIVTPVYNDWKSLRQLVADIDFNLAGRSASVMILVVDDGSTEIFDGVWEEFSVIKRIEIVRLTRNSGHQRAIAIGLAYLEKNFEVEHVVIMDADGEDNPSEIPNLIKRQREERTILFAKRGRRRESLSFRFFYAIYRVMFRLLAGRELAFGNFCVIPGSYLRQVVFLPEIWGHFASGILRSGLPQTTIRVDRNARYHGKTKMNFLHLVMHGLNAFSVYTDIISVRLILFTISIMLATMLGAAVLIYIRYFTLLAIPGWATTVGFGLVVVLLQALLMLILLAFNVLISRGMQPFIPARHFEDYLLKTEVVYERP
jgi:glycosyltransferase involved in cell wall biosynthesis